MILQPDPSSVLLESLRTDLSSDALRHSIVEIVREVILNRLAESRPGHCLRVGTLAESAMRDLCASLTARDLEADVVLLLGPRQHKSAPWEVSATRLVELRNAERRPLLVFVPPGLRTPAEDSFDLSTFVELDLTNSPRQLRQRLRAQLPEEVQRLTDLAIGYLRVVDKPASDDAAVGYYLTLLQNLGFTTDPVGVAGGAIYKLGLMPDFDLYRAPDRIKGRLSRNTDSLHVLIGGASPLLGRIHQVKLADNTIQAALYRFLRAQPVGKVAVWGAIIATDPAFRHLAFDQWRFEEEERRLDHLLLYVDELELPARDKKASIGPDNPRYLEIQRAATVKLRWITEPKPAAVDELAYFRIEIVSTEDYTPGSGGAIAWESPNIRVSKSTRPQQSKSLKVADFRNQVEDGLYFFRVRAYSAGGDIINEEDAVAHGTQILRDPHNLDSKRHHESEDVWFWVRDGHKNDVPPVEPVRNIAVESFAEAQLLARLAAIDRGNDPFSASLVPRPENTGWATAKGRRTEATYNIVYDAQARFTLTLSNRLRQIESDTLRQPDNLGRWRLNLATGHDWAGTEPALRPYHVSERVPEAFLKARTAVLAAIRGGEADLLTTTTDLTCHADLITAYAQAYADWLAAVEADFQGQAIREEGSRRRTAPIFLDLDVVEIVLPGDSGDPDRAYLLAPTHPLRLLWHLQRASLAGAWLRAALDTGQPREALNPNIRDYLRRAPSPLNLPPSLRPAHDGYPEGIAHFYVEHGPVTPFWSLYLREDARDSGTLRARVETALGISRQPAPPVEIGANALSRNLQRYLVQHPYVRPLKINAFNPGDAGLIVDAILDVERTRLKARWPELRYELRLFTHSGQVDGVGGAVDELLNPERQVSTEADAFSVPSRNPLYPKLHFSRNSLQEYLVQPEAYEAHISILHDLFPVKVALQSPGEGRSSFLHGLIQEQVTEFAGDDVHYAWQRQLQPAPCQEITTTDSHISACLAELLSRTARLQASITAGKLVPAIPTVQLDLELGDKGLLYQIHEYSDWVLTLDRHLGLEYFDSDVPDDRPMYLLDFKPEFGGADTSRLMLTTRSVDEVCQLIRPALEDRDLLTGEGIEVYFLRLLRSLSGRLALKLISAPTQVSEALGLAMARLFLEQYDLLADRILLPLDAHSDLFADASREDPLRDDVSLQRGDLLLVSCDPIERRLRFDIVEVKFQSDLSSFGAYVALQQRIEGQVTNSEDVLRRHFDPHRTPTDRLDRQVKAKELISLLSFYLARSHRYGLVSTTSLKLLRTFVESLDRGYQLECTGVGLIFDLGFRGVETHEEHPGLVYHRVGRDYVERLLNNGLRRRALLQEQVQAKPAAIEEAERQAEERQQIVRDTTLQGDVSYQRVRTHFGLALTGKEGSKRPPTEDIVLPISLAPAFSPAKPIEPAPAGQQPGTGGEATAEPVPIAPTVPETETRAGVPTGIAPQPVAPLAPTIETMPPEGSRLDQGPPTGPAYEVLLGDTVKSEQYGLLGIAAGKRVALDLNGTNTISLFGVQGGGKSYTVGSIVEMATQPVAGLNCLPAPLATVIFHYHESQDYPPEFVSMVAPNINEAEASTLAQDYGATPAALSDVLVLTSADKLSARRVEFPNVHVEPIYFSSAELHIKDWRFLMGVGGTQMYMKQINMIMRELRDQMTLETLRQRIEDSELSDQQKTIARIRLNFAAQFIDDSHRLADVLQPGRLIIVDLRDEFIDKDEALGLFVVMLNIFANAGREEGFNKLIVFDEAHKYMDNPDLTAHIVDVIRQMRHQGVSVLIASQDPPSLPTAIIELSSLVILHRFNSPQWLKHVQRSITSLSDLTPAQLAALNPGDAYVWATKATERVFTQKAVKVRFRQRVTQHGGGTKTAV
jgi:DNA phosphorothioation-dependent restriction protein DptH